MRKYMYIGLLLILALLFTGCGAEIVATVNGEEITGPQLDRRVEQYVAMYGYDPDTDDGKLMLGLYRMSVLESLIFEKVYFQEAKNRNITASKEDAEKEVAKFKAQFANEQEYKDYLVERRMTENEVLTIFQNQLIFNKLFDEVTKDITSTSRDLKQYYEDNKAEFYQDTKIKARNIVVETEEQALKVIERLDNGEDFAQLAVELSIDPSAKDNQGDVGYFDMSDPFVEEFKVAAFELKVGEYTKKPVKSTYGYHIILVEDMIEEHQRTFEEVEQELRDRIIMEEKNAKFIAFEDELMAKAEIKRFENGKEIENDLTNPDTEQVEPNEETEENIANDKPTEGNANSAE